MTKSKIDPSVADSPSCDPDKVNMAMRQFFRRHYASPAEMAYVSPTQENLEIYADYEARHQLDHTSWFGIDDSPNLEASINEVRRRVIEGWAEGAERIASMAGILPPEARSLRRRVVHAEFGNEIDIHRVYSGQLSRAWSLPRRSLRQAVREVTLVVPLGVKWSISAKQLFWRGAAILKMADLLQKAGYAVEIVGVCAAHNIDAPGKLDMIHTVQLKASSQPLDVSALAATCCMVGFVRIYCFRAVASAPAQITSAMGYYKEARLDKMVQHYIASELTGQHVITAPTDLYSQRAAEDWISESVKRIEEGEAIQQAA